MSSNMRSLLDDASLNPYRIGPKIWNWLSMPKLTLQPCMIPKQNWGKSLAQLHHQGRCKYWPTIRDEAFTKYGDRCAYCSTSGVHGHEVWEFDDKACVQKLVNVVPICQMCHHVIHLGLAEVLASEGSLNLSEVYKHFCKVRDIKKYEAEAIAREAFDLWAERSTKDWTVDFADYEFFTHEVGSLPSIESINKLPVMTDRQRKPSEVTHTRWLSVKKNPTAKPLYGAKKGTWLISGKMRLIDRIWPDVAQMTLDGHLGTEAYSSTALDYASSSRSGVLDQSGLIGVVLGEGDDGDEIKTKLDLTFGPLMPFIRFKGQG